MESISEADKIVTAGTCLAIFYWFRRKRSPDEIVELIIGKML